MFSAFINDVPPTSTETVQLQYKGRQMSFDRELGSTSWTTSARDAHADFRPPDFSANKLECQLCVDGAHTVARTAKLHSKFRGDLLASMLDAERVVCNMVLFHCTTCNSRFPTFHPRHPPNVDLQCLATCPVDVDTWEEPTEGNIPVNTLMAPYCRGRCARCARQLAAPRPSPDATAPGSQVAVFSAANRQDPLAGYPGYRDGLPALDFSEHSPLRRLVERHHAELLRHPQAGTTIEPLLTIDEGALRKTINYYMRHATVVEAMVVALQHMQISVCTMRGFSGKPGVSCYRKNIICFPQELLELQQLHEFFTNVAPLDVVNVTLTDVTSDARMTRRARLLERTDAGFLAEVEGFNTPQEVQRHQITRRVRLPWKPRDLRDYLIIFRRRNATKNEYVEDLRARRAFVQNLMQLLTIEASWRHDEDPGPMHQYFTGFDVLSAAEIEEVFPEDDVPEGLHFEDVDETDTLDAFTEPQFVQWLTEGRYDCEVAQTLLHAWTRFMKGTANDALSDFFHDLLREAHQAGDLEDGPQREVHDTNSAAVLSHPLHSRTLRPTFPCRCAWCRRCRSGA